MEILIIGGKEKMTVGELKELLEEIENDVEIGILECYDVENDIAEYQGCEEVALLPEEEETGKKTLIFSAFKTGIEEEK